MTNTTNTTSKMTQRQAFEALIETLDSGCIPDGFTAEALIEFLNGRIAQLDKKSASKGTGEHKPTAKQKENAEIRQAIVAKMVAGERYSATQIMKDFDLGEMSIQRVNALLSQMVADVKHDSELTKLGEQPTLVRTEEKGKVFFELA